MPCPDISVTETSEICATEKISQISKIRMLQFSEGQAKLYIENFLEKFDSCYKDFVEECFPTIKERFPFYMSCPHEYFIYMKDSDVLRWGELGYRSSEDGKVKINFKKMRSYNDPFPEKTHVLHSFSLDYILHNNNYSETIKTIDKMNTPKVDKFCVIRNWIFKFLISDLMEIFNENKE